MKEGRRRGGGGAASNELRFQLGKEGGKRGNVAFGKGEGARRYLFPRKPKFGIASAKKLARKVSSETVPYSELCMICGHHKRFR